MFAAWVVGINILTRSNFSSVAANISRQAGAANVAASGLTTRLNGAAAAGSALKNVLLGVGVASAAAFAVGIKGAADLQDATIQAAIALGRTGKTVEGTMRNMKEFRNIAIDMSSMTGQSVSDSMGVIARMASSGVSASQLRENYKSIAQYSDILHFGKDKMSYEDAATLGGGLTHDLRLMNAADSRFGLGLIGQLAYASPHGTNLLTTQIRRMASPLENILPGDTQSKARTIIQLAAWADRMGNLPFAGSAISQMTTQLVNPRSTRVKDSLIALGVFDSQGRNRFWDDKAGTLDLMGAIKQIQAHVDSARAQGHAGPAIEALFGGPQNMQRILQALTSKEALQQYNSVVAQMHQMGDDPSKWLDTTQALLMGGLNEQTGLLTSNFRTLTTLMADGLVPDLTRLLTVINNFLGGDKRNPKDHGFLGYLEDHPKESRAMGLGIAGAGALGVIGMLASTSRWLGISGHVGHMARLFMGIGHRRGKAAAAAKALPEMLFDMLAFGPLRRSLGGVSGVSGNLFAGLFANIFGRMGVPGISMGKTGIGGINWIYRIQNAQAGLFGRVGIPGKSMGKAGLFGINWAYRFGEIATKIAPVVTRISFLGEIVGKLGFRALPVIGNILMLADAINFLGKHSGQIGYYVGVAARWLAVNGSKLIVAAFVSIATSIVSAVLTVFNPMNWADAAKGLWSGLSGGGQQVHVTVNAPYHAPVGGNDAEHKRAQNAHARTVANKVAEVFSSSMRTGARTSGANPAPLGMSVLELSPTG